MTENLSASEQLRGILDGRIGGADPGLGFSLAEQLDAELSEAQASIARVREVASWGVPVGPDTLRRALDGSGALDGPDAPAVAEQPARHFSPGSTCDTPNHVGRLEACPFPECQQAERKHRAADDIQSLRLGALAEPLGPTTEETP